MVDWNDWRHFLAVARSGSTLAAARKLRVSQTTVARRIAALEQALGLALFERRSSGYVLTHRATLLVGHAEQIERAAADAEALAQAESRALTGTVRITAEEIFSSALLAPHLLELRDSDPGIRIRSTRAATSWTWAPVRPISRFGASPNRAAQA